MKNHNLTELNTIKSLLEKELIEWENASINMGSTLQDRKDARVQVRKIVPLISRIEDNIHTKLYDFIKENT